MAEECAPVMSHALTVSDLQFSNDNSMLLSVGRDRMWTVYKRAENGGWSVLSSKLKAHARIIWSCCWTPDDSYFITVSRDKSVKVWSALNWENVFSYTFDHAVTAVDVLASNYEADRRYVYFSNRIGTLWHSDWSLDLSSFARWIFLWMDRLVWRGYQSLRLRLGWLLILSSGGRLRMEVFVSWRAVGMIGALGYLMCLLNRLF
jgi:WD40 repeat protein